MLICGEKQERPGGVDVRFGTWAMKRESQQKGVSTPALGVNTLYIHLYIALHRLKPPY